MNSSDDFLNKLVNWFANYEPADEDDDDYDDDVDVF